MYSLNPLKRRVIIYFNLVRSEGIQSLVPSVCLFTNSSHETNSAGCILEVGN